MLLEKAIQTLSKGYANVAFNELDALYFEVFGKNIDRGCGACVMGAYQDLLKWKRAQTSTTKNQSMYKFSKEYENKAIVLYNNGVKIIVTKDNLTDDIANMILSNPKFKPGILVKVDDVQVAQEKKTLSSQLTEFSTSISTEAKTEGNELSENLNEKELQQKESQPLTEEPKKRRGRPKKS